MDELQRYLIECKKKKGFLFVPYHAFGDPDPDTSMKVVRTLFNAGADSIEIGLPFSDPVADGPVLQRTFRRILQHEFSMQNFIDFLSKIKEEFPDKKILVMGYINLFLQFGIEKLFEKFYKNNVRGVIIPDVPMEEKSYIIEQYNLHKFENKISWIDFITPTTQPHRLVKIAQNARGFIYMVSYKGVTGRNSFDLKPISKLFKQIRKYTGVPILVGFGVKTSANVKMALEYADGFIIASRLHELIEQNLNDRQKIPGLIEQELKLLLA